MPSSDRKRQNDTDATQDIERLLAEPVAAARHQGEAVAAGPALSGHRNASGRLSRTQRGKRGMAGQRPDRYEARQKDADERRRAWEDLTPNAQLKALAGRPGESKRQRAKIEARLAKEKAPPAPKVAATPAPVAAVEPSQNGKQKKSKK